jgi:hypothetical protein
MPLAYGRPQAAAQSLAGAKPSTWPFVALCGYLLSQIYLIPFMALGPSWAVWPRLADVAVGLMLAAALVSKSGNRQSTESSQAVFRLLVIGFIACVCSFFLINMLVGAAGRGLALDDGQYYLYRVTQFLIIYWTAIRVPLTPLRQRILSNVATVTLVVTCVLCLLTWVGVPPGPRLVQHLPQNKSVAGPWVTYVFDEARGYGLISYNRAYVAAQLLLLLALKLNLEPKRKPLLDVAYIALALAACFVSGSRSGFAAMGLFTFALFVRNPIYVPVAGLLLGLGSLFVSPEQFSSGDITKIATEQTKITNPMEAEQFRARVNLWGRWLERFAREPHLLVMGIGFGGARGDGGVEVAHMQYLTVLGEFGIFGLLFFLWLFYTILHGLWRYEPKPNPIFWATVALLFGAATQETFYPVVAFGHFLGLYFFAVALALRPPLDVVSATVGPARGQAANWGMVPARPSAGWTAPVLTAQPGAAPGPRPAQSNQPPRSGPGESASRPGPAAGP